MLLLDENLAYTMSDVGLQRLSEFYETMFKFRHTEVNELSSLTTGYSTKINRY